MTRHLRPVPPPPRHPEPLIAACPWCGALARVPCIRASWFMPDGYVHPERHAAAIGIDGRTVPR